MTAQTLEGTLSRTVGFSLTETDFETLAFSLSKRSGGKRRQLVGLCRRALEQPRLIRAASTRVALCKLLCASLPESEATIHSLLQVGGGKDRYEVQFSLFCFLDRVVEVSGAHEFAARLPDLVETYLVNVPAETALASWMAAHMLADHWPRKRVSTRVFIRVLKRGKYAAGRHAALTGLKEILDGSINSSLKATIRDAILRTATRDRSPSVKTSARSVLRRRIRSGPHNRLPGAAEATTKRRSMR